MAVNLNALWEERHRCPDPFAALHFLPEQWAEQLTEQQQEEWALERLCPRCFRSFPDPSFMIYHRDNECQSPQGGTNHEACGARRMLNQRGAPVPPAGEGQPAPSCLLEQLGAANLQLTPATAKGAYWGPPIPKPSTAAEDEPQEEDEGASSEAGTNVDAVIESLTRRVEE